MVCKELQAHVFVAVQNKIKLETYTRKFAKLIFNIRGAFRM